MHICYVDESGTSVQNNSQNTSHFVLAGIALPITNWREADRVISNIKQEYGLEDTTEIHTAWILRSYIEQRRIPGFENLDPEQRKMETRSIRNRKISELSRD